MTDRDEAIEIVRQHVDALNRGNRVDFESTLTPDAVLSFHAAQRVCRGPEAIATAFWGLRDNTTGGHWDIVHWFGDGTNVAIEYVRTYDSSRVGTRVSVPECALYTLRDGRVAMIRHYSDRLTELVQLKAIAVSDAPDGSLDVSQQQMERYRDGTTARRKRFWQRRGLPSS